MILGQILLATLLGGLASVLAAYCLGGLLRRFERQMVGFAAGALLAAALLLVLPEALGADVSAVRVLGTVFVALVALFALEKLALWRHAHWHDERAPSSGPHSLQPAGYMVLVGDGLHNFVDGILIAAAFLTSPVLGWSTALAVVLHEIPQELGDFMLLVNAGWTRRKALVWNALASMTACCGGALGYFALSHAEPLIPYVLAVSAASFLYIAVADLVPLLQQERSPRALAAQLVVMAVGSLVVTFDLWA